MCNLILDGIYINFLEIYIGKISVSIIYLITKLFIHINVNL